MKPINQTKKKKKKNTKQIEIKRIKINLDIKIQESVKGYHN